jgi:hypothetical protein
LICSGEVRVIESFQSRDTWRGFWVNDTLPLAD